MSVLDYPHVNRFRIIVHVGDTDLHVQSCSWPSGATISVSVLAGCSYMYMHITYELDSLQATIRLKEISH